MFVVHHIRESELCAREQPLRDDFGQAIGAGIRYQLPIGPLRLDAGWNPDRQPGEDEWAVHFSIGMAF